MVDYEQALESLRQTGYRLTPQRLLVLSVIKGGGHLSAEEIHAKAVEQYPFMDMATVYRTLGVLRRLGLVTEAVGGDGPVRFELSAEPHHHLVCRECGETTPLDDDLFAPVRAVLQERMGFVAELEHLRVLGTCSRCSAQGRRGERRRSNLPA